MDTITKEPGALCTDEELEQCAAVVEYERVPEGTPGARLIAGYWQRLKCIRRGRLWRPPESGLPDTST